MSNRQKTRAPKATTEVDVYVGQRLRLRRQWLNLSQQELSVALGLTFQQLQKYESGGNRMSASRLFQLSYVLGVPISWFFDGIGKRNDKDQRELFRMNARGEIWRLARAYERIKNPQVRRRIRTLASAMANAD